MNKNNIVKIPICGGQFAVVDKIDEHLRFYFWHYLGGYPVKSMKRKNKTKKIFLHHVIMGQSINGLFIDHIDGDPLNNRRSNLRFVTKRENCSNRKDQREGKTSSTYVGVNFDLRTHKWRAQVYTNGKCIHLGYFKDENQASRAYQNALLKLG